MVNRFLPTSKKEMDALGWEQADVIIISGDAYIDHPAFGTAVIARLLESLELKVAVVPQPNWKDDLRDFKKMGTPRYFFAVSSGNMDSMVNHYTANIRLRSDDAYTTGGKAAHRPDYATTEYCTILKKLFPEVPVIIGGIEASLRRIVHYDYWSDKLFPSILVNSKADLLVYGMAEKSLVSIIQELRKGKRIDEIRDVPQTGYLTKKRPNLPESIDLPSFRNCITSKDKFGESFRIFETNINSTPGKTLIQAHDEGFVVLTPHYPPVTSTEMDAISELPFTRLPHPRYKNKEAIPAFESVKNSVIIHRGCFGGCSFCTLAAHQGKFISSRSEDSIVKEVKKITESEGFGGHVTDLGGPSANMYRMEPKDPGQCKKCRRPACIYPSICANLNTDPTPLIQLYRKIRSQKGVKKVSIGSGVRYDLHWRGAKNQDRRHNEYLEDLITYHVSGRLKVAPEHMADDTLRLMRKPPFQSYLEFHTFFSAINKRKNLNQQLIPYFISSHPGCSLTDMAMLAVANKTMRYYPEQVQDFTPTPSTLSSVIYYTGTDPYTGKKVYVARSQQEKKEQKSFFFWHKPEIRNLILRYLKRIGREDLVKGMKTR